MSGAKQTFKNVSVTPVPHAPLSYQGQSAQRNAAIPVIQRDAGSDLRPYVSKKKQLGGAKPKRKLGGAKKPGKRLAAK